MPERSVHSFPVPSDLLLFKQQLLVWCNRYSNSCLLDSHHFTVPEETTQCLAAAGGSAIATANCSIDSLFDQLESCNDWVFGHLGYHAMHAYLKLPQPNIAAGQFPHHFFFCPETVINLQSDTLTIETWLQDPEKIFRDITSIIPQPPANHFPPIHFTPAISKEKYLQQVTDILQHIQRGDCYEINYCQAFVAPETTLDPLHTYRLLMQISPSPFSCFYKQDQRYLFCASPERFLQKKGNRLRSQPIKGTIRRNLSDPEQDEQLKASLLGSAKNRSENIMVVDLVRNDLSTICREGTVAVTELLGLYSFPQVHQLISTVEGELKAGCSMLEIFSNTFPMGSMTGAPKRKVMELIDKYESVARGIYSGSVGYIKPNKDFDFNVVIRSIVYLADERNVSFQVGGGITAQSDPEQEYEECLLKGKALLQLGMENTSG